MVSRGDLSRADWRCLSGCIIEGKSFLRGKSFLIIDVVDQSLWDRAPVPAFLEHVNSEHSTVLQNAVHIRAVLS